jgi:hypothetical protein
MEQFQFLRHKAVEKLQLADHMLFTTYPLMKDPKLLLAILENVNIALEYTVAAALHYERFHKRLPAFQETSEARHEMFVKSLVPRLNLSQNYVKLISDVKNLLSAHKKSPVAFSKKDKYVILSHKYEVSSVDVGLVKKYVFEAKLFLSNITVIVTKHERSVV